MKKISTIFLQIVIVLIGIIAAGALIWEPQLEGVNAHATNVEIYFKDPFIALVYVGSIPFFVALYEAFKILRFVKENKIFSPVTTQALQIIKYCAITTIGFVAIEEFFIMLNHGDDDPAGAVFVGILITLGSIIAASAATVLERILQNATETKFKD